MPSLLILDDLHLICPAPGDSPDNANASGNGSAALVEWLCSVLDHFRPAGKPTLPGNPPSHPPSPTLFHQVSPILLSYAAMTSVGS